MRFLSFVPFSLAILTGCATDISTSLTDHERLLAADLVRHVQCEMKQVYADLKSDPIAIQNWRGKFELTLDLDQSRGATSALGAVVSLAQIANPLLPLIGGGYSKSASRSITLKYTISPTSANAMNCVFDEAKTKVIQGDFGLKETFLAANQEGNAKNLDSLTHKLAFVVRREITPKLSFEIKTLEGQGGFSNSSRLAHTITAVFVKTNTPSSDMKLEALLQQQILRNTAK